MDCNGPEYMHTRAEQAEEVIGLRRTVLLTVMQGNAE